MKINDIKYKTANFKSVNLPGTRHYLLLPDGREFSLSTWKKDKYLAAYYDGKTMEDDKFYPETIQGQKERLLYWIESGQITIQSHLNKITMQNLSKIIENLINQSMYKQAAEVFLTHTETEFSVEFLKNDFHFSGDKEKRDIYKITFKRGSRKFTLKFGQSIANSGFYIKQGARVTNIPMEALAFSDQRIKSLGYKYNFLPIARLDTIHRPETPTPYDVLACLTKYEVGTFEDFCGDFGYDTDSRTAKKTYKAVKREFGKVCEMWTDAEIEAMQNIA